MDFTSLGNGTKIPMVGLGTWQIEEMSLVDSVLNTALDLGYRHFDTAYTYCNEKAIGKVLQKWFLSGRVKREELFITSKLPEIGMHSSRVAHFLDLSLKALGLEYLDLYLIHCPFGVLYVNDTEHLPEGPDGKVLQDKNTDLEAIWMALEDQVRAGKTKSIGLSNFSVLQTKRILKVNTLPIAAIQVEFHVYFQQKTLRELCEHTGIRMIGYGSLGSLGRSGIDTPNEFPALLQDPVVLRIALNHKKIPSQVLLRFVIQEGIPVIPKSADPNRLASNFQLTSFELSSDDMEELRALDKAAAGRSFSMASIFPGCEEHPEYYKD